MDNYRLSSAMSLNGVIRMAGTVVSKAECSNINPEVLEVLLLDDHLIETNEPVTTDGTKRVGINRLLPKRSRASVSTPDQES